jgi:hypothetical protein
MALGDVIESVPEIHVDPPNGSWIRHAFCRSGRLGDERSAADGA